MRPTRVLALTGLSVALLGTANADIESSFGAGYTSDYIFRGGDVGNNLFDISLDFSGSGEVGGLGELWGLGLSPVVHSGSLCTRSSYRICAGGLDGRRHASGGPDGPSAKVVWQGRHSNHSHARHGFATDTHGGLGSGIARRTSTTAATTRPTKHTADKPCWFSRGATKLQKGS